MAMQTMRVWGAPKCRVGATRWARYTPAHVGRSSHLPTLGAFSVRRTSPRAYPAPLGALHGGQRWELCGRGPPPASLDASFLIAMVDADIHPICRRSPARTSWCYLRGRCGGDPHPHRRAGTSGARWGKPKPGSGQGTAPRQAGCLENAEGLVRGNDYELGLGSSHFA
jgi:hypothetical protein